MIQYNKNTTNMAVTMNAIVFIVSVCNYMAPLSPTQVQSIYFNQFSNTLKTCTKNNISMDIPTNHKFMEISIPCVFTSANNNVSIIDIKQYDASTSSSYLIELMLYAIAQYTKAILNYDYQMMIVPSMPILKMVGLGTKGGSFTWYVGASNFNSRVFAHEFGHNLGFGHAWKNGLEYGDDTSVMGKGVATMCYSAPHRYIAELDSPQQQYANITALPTDLQVIDKNNYIIINDTIFVEAKLSSTNVYYLTPDDYTCNLCTLKNKADNCAIPSLKLSITLNSSSNTQVSLMLSYDGSMITNTTTIWPSGCLRTIATNLITNTLINASSLTTEIHMLQYVIVILMLWLYIEK